MAFAGAAGVVKRPACQPGAGGEEEERTGRACDAIVQRV